MAEKFTPGRYRRAFNMSRNGKTVRGLSPCRIENEKGVVIAFTIPQKSRQEQIANTNLLAAAPEMYKMLVVTRKMFEDLADVLPNEQAKDLLHDMASDIESVLTKARGEE